MSGIRVYKVGGPALEDPGLTAPLADEVRRGGSNAVLVHGGGRAVDRLLKALHIESRFAAETIAELARRGHVIDRWGEWNELAGHAHGITIDARTGVREGGSDPRSDGIALGC